MNKKKALVTGGCGFVGRHMCKRLHDDGYYVVAVDNLVSEGSMDPGQWPAHLYISDSMNFVFMHMSCQEFFDDGVPYFGENPKWDLVIHLAAVVGGRNTIENEPLLVAKDLEIDSRFFNWAVGLTERPGIVVYFSSSAAYPIDLQTFECHRALKEDDLRVNTKRGTLGVPDMSYGWAKLTGEFLTQLAREKYGLNVAVYRPFSGYGEDQAECYPFPSILKKIMSGEKEIEIWSDSYRDFVYIDDIVDCVITTMHRVAAEKTELNIASGRATSFSELARLIAKEIHGTDDDLCVKVAGDKPKGVYYRVGDTTKASAFGWTAQTSLEDAIKRIVRAYAAQ